MTEGEYRVGTFFNPSKMDKVSVIKSKAAELIDTILEGPGDERCKAIACTEIESAVMWAVKAITKPPRESN